MDSVRTAGINFGSEREFQRWRDKATSLMSEFILFAIFITSINDAFGHRMYAISYCYFSDE